MARVISDRRQRRTHSVDGTEMLRVAQCDGKKRFTSPKLAWRVGRRKKAPTRDTYRCEFCGGWHLGNPSR